MQCVRPSDRSSHSFVVGPSSYATQWRTTLLVIDAVGKPALLLPSVSCADLRVGSLCDWSACWLLGEDGCMGDSGGVPTEVSEQFFSSLSDEFYDMYCGAYYDSGTP
jgi:hypothetical protein